MTAASASHRLLNLVQSALLLGLMAAIAWIAVTAIVGPETGLLRALAMVGGLLFAPALPRRLLLSAYQAQRLFQRWGGCRSHPDGIAMCHTRGVEAQAEGEGIHGRS